MTDLSLQPPPRRSERLPPHPLLVRYYQNEEQRRRRVDAWFDVAASDYDWITQAMSLGFGDRYRRVALLRAGLAEGMSLLDAGSGTGAVAMQAQAIVGGRGLVAALDPSLGMLRQAAARGVQRRLRSFAESLPFPSESFDMVSMGYALRHVADLRMTFREYLRVLKPGGKLLLLEITPPVSRLSHAFLKLYLGRFVPLLARFGHGGRASRQLMEYYWDTIESCVPPAVIVGALADTGFQRAERHVELKIFSEYTAER